LNQRNISNAVFPQPFQGVMPQSAEFAIQEIARARRKAIGERGGSALCCGPALAARLRRIVAERHQGNSNAFSRRPAKAYTSPRFKVELDLRSLS